MSVTLNKKFAHFLVSTVYTLKIHKNDLEKNRRHSQLILLCSSWTFTLPRSPLKVLTPDFSGLFFYRLTKLGTFNFLLVILSDFLKNLKRSQLWNTLAP